MHIIHGVKQITHRVHGDTRGDLVAFERSSSLPFPLERVFFMKVDERSGERGGHANSCHEYIVAVAGSVVIDVDNGRERASVRLTGHDQALWVGPGVLLRLRDFSRDTVLLVCASQSYAQTTHYPQPVVPADGALLT